MNMTSVTAAHVDGTEYLSYQNRVGIGIFSVLIVQIARMRHINTNNSVVILVSFSV
jgi:hypothetical protein